MPDPGADATGIAISIALFLILSGIIAVKDYFSRD